MNNQMLMDNYLMNLKSTMEVYVHGTLESSNNDIRQVLKECLNETLQEQADTYDLMTKYGWYTVNNVESKIISQTLNKVQTSGN